MFGLSRFFGRGRESLESLAKPIPFEQVKRRVKIVVVDDEKDVFPVEALKQSGYTIDWWPSVDAAGLQRLEDAEFDIVVLDIQGVAAPGLSETGDGRGVLRRLKLANPRQIVIACSGLTFDIQSTDFFRQADDILGKPVTVTNAKEVLDNLIKTRIGPSHYWDAVVGLLRQANIGERQIQSLQTEFVKNAQKGRSLPRERIMAILGDIKDVGRVIGLLETLYRLFGNS